MNPIELPVGDRWQIVLVAAAWSAAVGVVGFLGVWLVRRRSLRYLPAGVALVAIVAVVAAIVGTARAMFLSAHDYSVVLLVSVVAGVVALVFAMAVGASVVRWSRSLQEQTRRFGESGRFVPGSSAGPAEFQQVADELARTSDRLHDAQARTARLEESRRELISWVSHDLRTPLAGLRAMTEALEDGLAEDPARYHRQMGTEVDRMVRMVDDLFELSRINAGVLALDLETLELGDIVSEAIAAADPVARAGAVRLVGEVPRGVLVRADPGALSRVVANLVMNAVRHTPPSGRVEILGRAVQDGIEISVRDECGGIPPDERQRVFEVAWRGSQARTPEPDSVAGGAGLGLAIVKGLVEAHHGRVAVSNEGRSGCCFLVHLPA